MAPFEHIDLVNNPEPRCPCILLLDTSGSMAGEPIEALNAGLLLFQQDLQKDHLAGQRCEIAIVSFGDGGVQVLQDFVTASQLQAPRMKASGMTPMGEAITVGLDMLAQRKQVYKQMGIAYYRPWLFMITDGEPTDAWQSAASRIQQESRDQKVAFFVVGIQNANMEKLAQIAPPDRRPMHLQGLRFADLFLWLSASQKRVSSSRINDPVPLPSPDGWAAV